MTSNAAAKTARGRAEDGSGHRGNEAVNIGTARSLPDAGGTLWHNLAA
jgi:hypothetical protein